MKIFLILWIIRFDMNYSQLIKESFREELDRFDVYLRHAICTDNPRIQKIVDHVFLTDGKRVRPMLVFLVAKACGNITEATYHGAVTVELLHTATLIHDDVVDESKMRRGQPSTHTVFDNKRAVLLGDYLLSSSLHESVKTGSLEIVNMMSELGQNLSEGELDQYSIANDIIIDEEEYFRVIDKKTASLLYVCTKIGAITAGADKETIEKFGEMGRLIGICFQIRDDIFDYFKADVGKPTGNDIREGKITLPLIYSLRTAPQPLSAEMRNIIQRREYSPGNIERLLDFAKQNGGIDYALQTIENLSAQAREIVEQLPIDNEFKTLFDLLLMYLKNRAF